MSIPVFKPQHVRWLPKPITLWAVWEGVDGQHHEEAHEYTHEHRTEVTSVRCLYDYALPQTQYMRIEPAQHPLLTDDYKEDPTQVLPDTLRFIRIEDTLKLYRYMLNDGSMVVFHHSLYRPAPSSRVRALNGYELDFERLDTKMIVHPRTGWVNEPLTPNEFPAYKEMEYDND